MISDVARLGAWTRTFDPNPGSGTQWRVAEKKRDTAPSDFIAIYALARGRFDAAIEGLSGDGLVFRAAPGTLSPGEMALHVAGVELSFAGQLTGEAYEGEEERVRRCATEGVVDEGAFPFAPEEIRPELVARALAAGRRRAEALLAGDAPEIRAKELRSALGPVITGEGAFARLAFHPQYHHGQAHLLTMLPGFPRD